MPLPDRALQALDLMILTRMAQFYERQTNRTEALHFAEQSLEIDERLAALDSTNATWQRDVAVSRAPVQRLRG